jgi:small subunit ribosomal protein S6
MPITPCSGYIPGLYIHKEVIMNYYESIFILNPELPPEQNEKTKETMSEIVRKQGGDIHVVDDWGVKKLAYDVKKHKKGHFVLMQFAGSAGIVQELERNYRVNDGVIKYMTLRIEKELLQAIKPKESEPSAVTQPEQENNQTGE